MSNILHFPKILVLLMLITFATFLGLLFTPALPEISSAFQISETKAQWTMSIFMVGYALGQLPYGPIANRYGRKKAIWVGVVLALVGSLMAFLATEFWVLCLGRFIQALGSAVGLKVAFTMVGDLHAGEGATQAIALLTIAFGIMPGLANAIGGYITVLWGWQGCFLFLTLYTIVLWLFTFTLPETAKELHADALQIGKMRHGFARQFKDTFLMSHAFLVGLSTAAIYIFSTLSPYIAIQRMGLSPDAFGLWSLVPSLGLLTGAIVSRMLSKRNAHINMLSGILIILVGALILSLCFINQVINVWSLFVPMFIINIGTNLTWSNASAKALSEATDKSNASAVMQFTNVGLATVAVFLVEVVPPTTTLLLPCAFGLILVLMFAVWLKLKAPHPKHPQH